MSQNLVSGGAAWQEFDNTAGGAFVVLRLRRVRAGVYQWTTAAIGPEAGSLVSDGAGGYAVTIGDLSGTGLMVRVGDAVFIR